MARHRDSSCIGVVSGMRLPKKPSQKVLFWVRPDYAGRSIKNMQELVALVESYRLPYRSVALAVPLVGPSPGCQSVD